MRIKKKHLFFVLSLVVCGCQLTYKLERTNYRPKVDQPSKSHKTESATPLPSIVRENKEENSREEQVRTKDETTGEDVVTVDLEEVTVVARTKTVPERFGLVNLDFIVTVPKKLIDKRWMIKITPKLEKANETISLEDVIISGELYSAYQERGKSMYEALALRYMYFNRKTDNITKYYTGKYNFQFNEDARLDTIISTENSFKYYYTQETKTDEAKKMDLFLSGKVSGLDKSNYDLPLSDTLTYFVSSMIQFLDHAPRFKRKIIERHAEANFSAHITFPVGKENVDEKLNDNAEEIAKVQEIIKKLTWSSEFIIDSINMTASASPEGSWTANEALAKRRALSLKSYFSKKMDDKQGVDTLFNAKWVAEDWKRVNHLIEKESEKYGIRKKDEILSIIGKETDPDKREESIRKSFPVDYKIIKDSLYPQLRTVEFQFNLHRSGMTKDTIHTTEPDTLYERGRKLLLERKYTEALEILLEYGDYNTAIAYMSLGYDKPAYDILLKEKKTSNSEYVLAVLCSRLGKEEEAVKRFLHSCELDPSKAWRGSLDPEINRIITTYNLQKQLEI